MSVAMLERLEADIRQLSLADQLALMERLARVIHQSTSHAQLVVDNQLAAMANDPEIQKELRQIRA